MTFECGETEVHYEMKCWFFTWSRFRFRIVK